MYLPAPDESLWVGVLRLSLYIPGSRSLKDRRRPVLSLRDRIQSRHHAAFAEVGHLDAIDRAVIAVALVSNDARLLRSRLDTIRAEVEQKADVLVEHQLVEITPFGKSPALFSDR